MKKAILVIFLVLSNLLGDYTNMKIQEYINLVATQNNINIATDQELKKKFNFYINKRINGDVNIQVLREVLDSNGYVLNKRTSDYYIIKKKEDLLINKIDIFALQYADTKKVKEKCDKILRGYFKNVKIIKSSQAKKNFTPMDEIKSGSNNSNINVTETEERIEYSINELDNKSLAVTYKDEFVPSIVRTIINQMDKPPARIRVKVKIYEVSTNALKEFGASLNINGDVSGVLLNGGVNSATGAIGLGAGYDDAISIGNEEKVRSNNFSVSAVINALEKEGNAKMRSEPSVLLYEGNRARLTEGKTFPIRSDDSTVTGTATTTSAKFEEKDTGLTLDLNFEQYRSGMIYLDLNLKINIVQSYDPEDRQIITIKRELVTKLMIEPNVQIDMAGLTTKTNSTSQGGIPILKEIPWIGRLFEFEKEVHDSNMLVIQLIAQTIDNSEDKYLDIWN